MVTGTKITAVLPLVGNYHLQRAQGLRAWGTLPASARTHTLLSIRLEHSQAGMIVRIFTYLSVSSRATPHCAAAAKSFQLCPTLCDPIDGSPQGSSVPGILQARTLEPVSNAWKWKVKVKLLSRVQLFATPWTAAHQAPPSMGFSRQEYWSGVPVPLPTVALVKHGESFNKPEGSEIRAIRLR